MGGRCIGRGIFTGTPLESVCFPQFNFFFCLILGIFQVIIDKKKNHMLLKPGCGDAAKPREALLVDCSLVRSLQNVKPQAPRPYSLNFIKYLQKKKDTTPNYQIWPAGFEINLIISSDGNVPLLLPSKFAEFTNTVSHLPRCPAVFMQSANITALPESEPNVEGHNAQG